MSHQTKVTDVQINDIAALDQAIRNLKNDGLNIDLVQNGEQRGYAGAIHKGHPYVIKVNDAQYDIGLVPEKDGSYSMVLDTWNQSVEKVVGVPSGAVALDHTRKVTEQQRAVGRITQEYAAVKLTNAAAAQGRAVTRSFDAATQQIKLMVSNY